jgi:hypothetical protein
MPELLEDQVIEYLCLWLSNNGWKIISQCRGHEHGIDIFAEKDKYRLIVEAKGSRGNPNSYNTTKDKFSSGQLKDHLGKAIVKVLDERNKFPNSLIAISHPDDQYIRKHLRVVISELIKFNIIHFWVNSPSNIVVEFNEANTEAKLLFHPNDTQKKDSV